MQKKYLILLLINILSCNIALAEKSISNSSPLGVTVGVNFDPFFLSPGVKLGYRINSYMGMHALAQYTSSDDASNIPTEKSIAEPYLKKSLPLYKYNNLFTSVVFDVYPLEDGLKFSAGLGYMDKKLTKKSGNRELTNKNKMVILGSIGYEGLFFENQGFGYDIEAGLKYLDKTLKSKTLDKGKSEYKVVPAVNIALTYSF